MEQDPGGFGDPSRLKDHAAGPVGMPQITVHPLPTRFSPKARTAPPESSRTRDARRTRPRRRWMSGVLALVALAVVASLHQEVGISEGLGPDHQEDVARSILALQPFRQTQSLHIRSTAGREGLATLINLNPSINAWYVMEVTWKGGTPTRAYHLENPRPRERTLRLDEAHPSSLMISEKAERYACDLFAAGPPDLLEQGRAAPGIFSALCGSRIYLRNPAVGHRTGLESVTEFLRDRVWGGEAVIGLGHHLLSDTNRQTATMSADVRTVAATRASTTEPPSALIDPAFAHRVMAVPSLGIGVAGAAGGMTPGAWYSSGTPGSYVSVVQPNLIARQILQGGAPAQTLDSVEGSALCYLVAFDLDRFRLGYARGTDHPDVGWSEHIPARMRDVNLPGPDGIGDITPLVGTGLLPPDDVRRTVATFTAGFKRAHGAFLSGALSLVNHGSHYGFIENGVVFSRLQPGLATILVGADDGVEMKTWDEKDNALLPRVRFARQNGVPLVEMDAASQVAVPGRLVASWGAGNWSGSSDKKLRTMRSGVALQISGGKRYLIVAVFSSATPSAMARVFQAYRCQYAMMLDMNALEHTYFAFYRAGVPASAVEYLMTGMREVDTNASTASRPVVRFIGYPDNRDFFYVSRRDEEAERP